MAIRLIAETSSAPARAVLRASTQVAREMTGCRHAEDFESVEDPDRLLHIELWDNATAWDASWAARSEALGGALDALEFYTHAQFAPTGLSWDAMEGRAQSLRWPTPRGAIRILILVTAPPELPVDFLIQNSVETRAELGCGAFEYARSLDYPENLALIESWKSPQIYDVHWQHRLAQNQPAPPPPLPPRYGEISFEWYPQCHFTLIDGVWQPGDAALRMDTVKW